MHARLGPYQLGYIPSSQRLCSKSVWLAEASLLDRNRECKIFGDHDLQLDSEPCPGEALAFLSAN